MKRWLDAWFFYGRMPMETPMSEIRRRIRKLRESPEDRAIAEARKLAQNYSEFEKLLRGEK